MAELLKLTEYSYLMETDNPSVIKEALKLYGTFEFKGQKNNLKILHWAKEIEEALGFKLGYTNDSIPWCGLFAAIVCVRAKWAHLVPEKLLWARSWQAFGQKADPLPSLGDILVFKRDGGGHVGFYVAEDDLYYHVLGGNQQDEVNIKKILKSRLLAARRPIWRVKQPSSVRPIYLANNKTQISTNEK